MTTKPKQSPEERLAQLERERALIVAALDECHLALQKGQETTFVVGKLVGTVEVVLGLPSMAPSCEKQPSVALQVVKRKLPTKQVLITKKELCDHLQLHNIKSVERMMRTKRIPFVRVSPRQVRFDLQKVEAALGRFEFKAASIHPQKGE